VASFRFIAVMAFAPVSDHVVNLRADTTKRFYPSSGVMSDSFLASKVDRVSVKAAWNGSAVSSRNTVFLGKGVGGQAQQCRKRRGIRNVRNLALLRRAYVRSRPIVLKKSANEIFVHCGAGIIRPRRALWINSFQPRCSVHGYFSTFKTTDFLNTIAQHRAFSRLFTMPDRRHSR